ncbi:MAG: response regulator receiver protein [Candidatus Solibacter sp.]|jgi:DNA-binding NtrC family response regulator|nr:response regulator receiver protein [Candidatus Solibacter sp.]
MAQILLVGLDRSTSDDLKSVLIQLGQTVQTASHSGSLDFGDTCLVFTECAELGAIRTARPDLPVVVVSRLPEVSAWLDALEHGAADYCGAPFERKQVGWVLNSSLPALRVAA